MQGEEKPTKLLIIEEYTYFNPVTGTTTTVKLGDEVTSWSRSEGWLWVTKSASEEGDGLYIPEEGYTMIMSDDDEWDDGNVLDGDCNKKAVRLLPQETPKRNSLGTENVEKNDEERTVPLIKKKITKMATDLVTEVSDQKKPVKTTQFHQPKITEKFAKPKKEETIPEIKTIKTVKDREIFKQLEKKANPIQGPTTVNQNDVVAKDVRVPAKNAKEQKISNQNRNWLSDHMQTSRKNLEKKLNSLEKEELVETVLDYLYNKPEYTPTLSKALRNNSMPKIEDFPSNQKWSDIPAVRGSGVTHQLNANDLEVQQLKLSILIEEATFLKSMELFSSFYKEHIKKHIIRSVVSEEEFQTLFSMLPEIIKTSKLFIQMINDSWQTDIMWDGIYSFIEKFAKQDFSIYQSYATVNNEEYLSYLSKKNESFPTLISFLENRAPPNSKKFKQLVFSPKNRLLSILSMLRKILSKTNQDSEDYQNCKNAIQALEKLCNGSAPVRNETSLNTKQEVPNGNSAHQMEILQQELVFPATIVKIPENNQRTLIRRDDVWLGGTKILHQLIVLSDYLLIARKESNEKFTVVDYVKREGVNASIGGSDLTVNIRMQKSAVFVTTKVVEFLDAKAMESWLANIDSH